MPAVCSSIIKESAHFLLLNLSFPLGSIRNCHKGLWFTFATLKLSGQSQRLSTAMASLSTGPGVGCPGLGWALLLGAPRDQAALSWGCTERRGPAVPKPHHGAERGLWLQHCILGPSRSEEAAATVTSSQRSPGMRGLNQTLTKAHGARSARSQAAPWRSRLPPAVEEEHVKTALR